MATNISSKINIMFMGKKEMALKGQKNLEMYWLSDLQLEHTYTNVILIYI